MPMEGLTLQLRIRATYPKWAIVLRRKLACERLLHCVGLSTIHSQASFRQRYLFKLAQMRDCGIDFICTRPSKNKDPYSQSEFHWPGNTRTLGPNGTDVLTAEISLFLQKDATLPSARVFNRRQGDERKSSPTIA
jgi:hypothetical protein